VFFHTFRERETLYNIIEALTGTRMTTSYTRSAAWRATCAGLDRAGARVRRRVSRRARRARLASDPESHLDEAHAGIGRISARDAVALSLTGPNLRGTGVAYDVRKTEPYSGYEDYDFDVPVGAEGDAYDRYWCGWKRCVRA